MSSRHVRSILPLVAAFAGIGLLVGAAGVARAVAPPRDAASAHAVEVRPLPRLVGGEARPRPAQGASSIGEDAAPAPDLASRRRSAAEAALGAWAGAGTPRLEARWNAWTGLPHRVFGPRLAGPVGAPLASASSAEAAARAFLFARPALWAGEDRPAAADLALVKSTRVGATWFLVFQQRHRGIDVEGGRVDLRLRDDGAIVLVGSDWFPGVRAPAAPRLPFGVADARARLDVGFVASRGDVLLDEGAAVVIVPLPGAHGAIDYRLAHRVRHRVLDPPGLWQSHVDAETGETLARENLLRFDTLTGTTTGLVHLATPTDVPVVRPFQHQVVASAVDSVFSTPDGTYALPNVSTGIPVRTALRSPFVEVFPFAGARAAQSTSAPANDVLDWAWTPANSDTAERDAYYHTLVARDWVKGIDPGFTALDYRMPCQVNIANTCNAFWDGTGINFYRWGIRASDGKACANTATIADVVYHEVGHGRTQFVFEPFAPSGAMHEGFSDYLAASLTDQPFIGRGFFGPGTTLRTVANTQRIDHAPCLAESHCVGNAISGALWDLRGRLVTGLGPAAGVELADALFHFAGYGGAGWHEDYLLDLLVVDDDDGTLLNGTPHSDDICAAFTLRGIPCPTMVSGVWISHDPLPDAASGSGPFAVTAAIGSFAGGFDASSPTVAWRVNGGLVQDLAMAPLGGDQYQAVLPDLPGGGTVEYAITASDFGAGPASAPPAGMYAFYVGAPATVWADDFETDRGWTSAIAGASTGRWMRVDPNGTNSGGDPPVPYAPEDDHTAAPGTFCFVTHDTTSGQAGGVADVDGGCVTLTSPLVDLSALANARLEYWRWFTEETRLDDTLSVAVSPDGGATWVELERLYRSTEGWIGRSVDLGALVPLTAQFRLRMIACDGGGGSLVEAGLDDVRITTRVFSLVDVAPVGEAPGAAFLARATPNPARAGDATRLDFGVPRAASAAGGRTRLEVIDARGRIVRTLVDGTLAPGRYTRPWNGDDDRGARVGAGVYFVRLSIDGRAWREKVIRLD